MENINSHIFNTINNSIIRRLWEEKIIWNNFNQDSRNEVNESPSLIRNAFRSIYYEVNNEE